MKQQSVSNKDESPQEDPQSGGNSYARDHMANERTFLAWIRTSIGIMAFGFVVEKFAIFIKQVNLILERTHSQDSQGPVNTFYQSSPIQGPIQGYSSIFGVFLVALGVLICLFAFIKYKKVEQQIERDIYQPSILLDVMLALAVLLIGVFIVVYLSNSV